MHQPSHAFNVDFLESIYHFCIENNILISFFSNVYIIKDLQTNKELFRGSNITGLYPLRDILLQLQNLENSTLTPSIKSRIRHL